MAGSPTSPPTEDTDMARDITQAETALAAEMVARARAAMAAIADYDQARVDRLAQAIGWALGNEATFTRLAHMSVDESGIGDRDGRVAKRFKLHGILRDALRTPSVGVIEDDPVTGIVKYAKPAGVIASIVPMTNPELTPPGTAIYAIEARDAVIFSPHPRTKRTTNEVVRLLRQVMEREGAPADVFQCVEEPTIPLAQELMARCDLTLATGGAAMVKAAYSSGKPAFGVGGGNSTMVIDETADIAEAARNTRVSKTSDFGSGCSADGNLLVDHRLYDAMVAQLVVEGGHLATAGEKALLEKAMWDEDGSRIVATVAQPAPKLAAAAGFTIAEDRTFIVVEQDQIGPEHRFSGEKLTTLLAVYRYHGFDDALAKVRQIYEVAGKGHSCGIHSHDDDHIDALARTAPVSRIMVRQPQSKANAGSFTNGMPMTSSLGCGIWGGNVTNENISLKHYLNVTWVSRPIPEDRPSEQELFGDFYGFHGEGA
jgi:sulfoacetaldehyde dehydrogenase